MDGDGIGLAVDSRHAQQGEAHGERKAGSQMQGRGAVIPGN